MIKNSLFKLIRICFYALPRKTQHSLQTKLQDQDNNILNYKIEFQNGDACKIQNYETLTNKMQFSNKHMILKAIRAKLFPLENILILTLIIVVFCGQEYVTDRLAELILIYTFSCILFQMGISSIQILITWYQRQVYENLVNNQICVIFTEISQLSKEQGVIDSYTMIKWQNLKIGQIVCLQNGDHSPGDLLILDSSTEQIIVNFQQREPCLSTFVSPTNQQKGVIIDYKINLSGWVQFTYNEEEVQGTLKLKNDPKVSQFNNKNIIMRGEILNSTNWLFGMVIRVGKDCQKIGYTNKDTFYGNKRTMTQKTKFQIFLIFLIILGILFTVKVIFDTSISLDQQFFNTLSYCLLLIPQNLLWINELWHFVMMIINNQKFQRQNKLKSQINSDQQQQKQNVKILSENTSKILIPIPKLNITSLNTNRNNETQMIESNFQNKGIQTLSSVDMLDLLQPDLLIFDNPQNLISKQARVLTLLQGNNKYSINYDKVIDIVQNTQSEAKINFEKLLIDTNRFHTYDEKKPTDLDKLIEEKQVPNLRPIIVEVQEEEVQYNFQKPGFFREKSQNGKDRKNNGDTKNLNPYASFRKASARNLFVSNASLIPNSNNNSPSALITKQRSQYFGKSNLSHSKAQNSVLQKSQQDNSSDQLVGDVLSEKDFLERLFMKDDMKTNEMLIATILCNNIQTYFHQNCSELKIEYSNKYDPSLIEFASIFDYNFICATTAENNHSDYVVNQIIKKVISIQGTVKVFEILCMLEPTEGRKNTLSLLIRDPESFLLEEGSILYSRIEANVIDFQNKEFTQQLEQMIWDGQKIFIYQKKQLDRPQTQDFLKKYVSIMESYGDRQEELEKHFLQIEKQSEILFAVGLKQIYNNAQLCQNDINKQSNLFLALQHNDCRVCIMNDSNYDDLLIFLRTYQIVNLKDEILQLNEKEPLLLKYKIQQNIAYLIEQKLIFNIQEHKHLQKFIIIGNEAFQTIINDDYLKYHLAFISQYASGFGTNQFTSTNKQKLMKLFKLTNSSVIGIGNSLNNNYFFHKCNASFCVAKFNSKNQQITSIKEDPQITISKPNFIIQKLKDLLVILLVQSQLYNLNNQIIMEIQIYRCFMVGLLIYQTTFILNNMDLFYLVLFFIFPSNIITSFIRYYFLFNSQTLNQSSICTQFLSKQKRIGNIRLIFQIILKGLIDSILLYVIYQINITFQEQGLLLLYSNLEVIEKSQYIFQILFENGKVIYKIKVIVSYCLSIIVLNFIFQFVIMEQGHIQFLYSFEGFLLYIFEIIFSLSLQYILFVIFSYFSVQFDSQYGYAQPPFKFDQIQEFIPEENKKPNSKKLYSKTALKQIFGKKDIIDDQILKALKGENEIVDTNEQLKSNLQFSNKRTEKDFISFIKYEQDLTLNQFIVLLFYDIILVILITYQTFIEATQYLTPMIITLISFSCQFILLVVFQKLVRSKFINKSIQVKMQVLSYLLRFAYKILVNINKEWNDISLLYTILYTFAFSATFISQIGLPTYVIMIFISLIVDLIFIGVNNVEEHDHNTFIILKAAIILIGLLYPIFYLVYRSEYLWRYSYILKNRLQAEYKKLNDVLGLLMPRFIKERMTKGQIQISEDQGEVTILFCDIYDFDKIIKSEQELIVEFLDNLYRSFDQLCQSNELQKIETVGKTYMAAAGLKDYDVELNQQKHVHSTQRVLDTAIKMLEVAKTMKYGNNEELILKIGVHYGRVIAGVIGAHKPQFSLIGDTVNTTSRVCSTGESGYITLSESAYSNIKEQKYTFKLREVQAKGKGLINTYQLILNQREITIFSESKHAQQQEKQNIKKTSLKLQKSERQEKTDKKLESVKKVTINQINKSPKLVIRQRQKDLQIQTPRMIIRQKVKDPQIFQSHEKPLDLYARIESINQLENRSKSKTVINRDGANLDQPQKGDFIEVENKQQFNNHKSIHQSIQISQSVIKKISQSKIKHSISSRYIQIQQGQQAGLERLDSQEAQQVLQQNAQQITRKQSIRRRGTIIMDKRLKKQSTKPNFEEKQSAKQLNNEGSLSAAFRSPKEQNLENIDEIEIPKYSSIVQCQKQLQMDFIQQLLKYKVDQQFVLAQDLQIYKSTDQQKYNELYDLFKGAEINQINKTIAFLSLFVLFKGLIYLILYEHFQQHAVELIIIIVTQISMTAFLNCVIFKLNNQIDQKIIKILLIIQMIITSIFDITILEFTQQLIFDVILQTMSITCTYINIFNLQIFSQYDRKKIAGIYLILSLLNISYQKYQYYILFYTVGITGMSYYSQYSEKIILVRNYQCNQQLESQQEKQKAILQYLLPAHILDRFVSDQDNTESFTDVFENTTVLFADIAGFTKYSSSVEPEQVVNMLRTLFQNFDEFCQKLNVYKLFTIGDCYVCMGIIDANNRNEIEEAVNVTLFGLKMIDIISSINKDPQFQHLNMRIGAHTGKLIGGVVGTDVVRYDVYGDDVTIANKMESNGSEGRMMVSESTKDLIEMEYEDMFEFTFAKEVYIASKDMTINGYYVELSQSIYE